MATSEWVEGEMERAITQWRAQFRGEPRVKKDTDVTDADIAEHNLILWGDMLSNKLIGRLVGWSGPDKESKLIKPPINYLGGVISINEALSTSGFYVTVGKNKFDVKNHVPIFIYPNPLNPKKYMVLNSGFTFRDYDYLNNARQTPKLPDWAIVDVNTPPSSRWPGKIVAAGFFDEKWQLKNNNGGAKR